MGRTRYLAMRMSDGIVTVNNTLKTKIVLPEGCIGFMFVFTSKKAAQKYYGKDVNLIRVKAHPMSKEA